MWIWGVVAGVSLAALLGALLLYDRVGRRRCPNCQTPVPESATTCPHCTVSLEEYLAEQKPRLRKKS